MTLTIEPSLPALSQLPQDYCIALSNFSAISLQGDEKSKYLQGQVTCDVNALDETGLLNGAHCDAKGKVFSVFRLINRADAHLLLQNEASLAASLAELKKFGVFAKVDITQAEDLSFYAVIGEQAATKLKEKFQQLPDSLSPVIQKDNTTIVYIAGQQARYILIDQADNLANIINALALPIYAQAIWDLLEINEGFPVLSEQAIGEYVPQMINVQAIHGISFTKGCYLGQETVARMQYLGKNKRALFTLTGAAASAVNSGAIIEKQLGENWRKAGDVLNSYRADNGETSLQVVLASDTDSTTSLRIKEGDSSTFTLIPLPYSINSEEA